MVSHVLCFNVIINYKQPGDMPSLANCKPTYARTQVNPLRKSDLNQVQYFQQVMSARIRAVPTTVPLLLTSQQAFSSRMCLSSTAMSSSAHPWPVTAYQPRHASWPYSARDFMRRDERSDAEFYGPPRFVTHIDDHAIGVLGKYYDAVLPKRGRILDFCSSWVSHYPPSIAKAAAAEDGRLRVIGMGMNMPELAKNALLNGGRVVRDLNVDAEIREQDVPGSQQIDAATCVVSIDYLTRPREVLESLRHRMSHGGTVHLVISNRCFPTKATRRWLEVDEAERLQMVGDYLHFAGWHKIEMVELCNRIGEAGVSPGKEEEQPRPTDASWMQSMLSGMAGNDPLWVVRASNVQEV